MNRIASFVSALVMFFALPAFAGGVPDAVTFAATLHQGAAPANGTFSVVLELFNDATAGTRVFVQSEPSLVVVDGDLVVDLGDDPTVPLTDDLLASGPLFLSITVNGEELTPRVPLTSVPFARRARVAEEAESLGGLGPDDVVSSAGAGLEKDGTALALTAHGVVAANLADGSVTPAALAAGAVTSTALATGAVTAPAIAAHAVSTAAFAVGAVDSAALGLKAVTAPALATAAVTAPALAANAVTAAALADQSVDTAAILDGAVTTSKIAAGSISSAQLKSNGQSVFSVSTGAAQECSSLPAGSLTTVSSCNAATCQSPEPGGCSCQIVFGTNLQHEVCSNTFVGRLVLN